MNKQAFLNRLLSEKELSYNKLKNRYKSEFDDLGIISNVGMQERLYGFCYDVESPKCANQYCSNTTGFISFKNGYRNTCSKTCSNVVTPRGRQSREYLQGIADRRITEQKQIDEESKEGVHYCEHGCGNIARFYSKQKRTWRCVERVQDCPSVRDKMEKHRPDTSGISKSEFSKPLNWNVIHFCEYGCGGLANYQLASGKFCCESYYHACDGSKKHRSEIMITKYQDSVVKSEFLEKMNNTLMKNHGVKWPSQVPGRHEKYVKTLQTKYGNDVTNPVLIPGYREINERRLINSSYSTKEYTWPSGRISKIQGYEDLAIDDLLSIYKEDEIKLFSELDLKPIPYIDTEGKNRNYYPDIILPDYNTIVEVKSQYTYKKDLDINVQKRRYCESIGYSYVWMIYSDRETKELLPISEVS